jgi:hypothetical protein
MTAETPRPADASAQAPHTPRSEVLPGEEVKAIERERDEALAALTSLRAEVVKVVEPFSAATVALPDGVCFYVLSGTASAITMDLTSRHFRPLAALHASLTGGKG